MKTYIWRHITSISCQIELGTSFMACGICPCTILQRIMCSRSTSLNIDNSPELDEVALTQKQTNKKQILKVIEKILSITFKI